MRRTTAQASVAAVPDLGPAFVEDVREFLARKPRRIPSRWFYDDLGSALFEAICRLPWYPLTRAEMRLLARHAREILDPDIATGVELGPGNGGDGRLRRRPPHRRSLAHRNVA